jgi:hypothetical protein
MKRATWMLTIVTMALMPLLATAQMGSAQKLTAKVPFEFTAGNQRIPAGECVVQAANPYGTAVSIRSSNPKISLYAMLLNGDTQKGEPVNALLFHKYGDTYFLSGIKLAGSQATYDLPQGKAEAELRAQNVRATDEVVLAAVR